ERLRRVLLGLITTIIVARPLVSGEDPGMLSPQTDASHLVLTGLWFVVAVGWVIWRVWGRVGDWHGGIIESALLVAAILVAVGAESAPYKHPAVLIAWEWIAFVVALFLMRQLTAGESDRRHVIAVFL